MHGGDSKETWATQSDDMMLFSLCQTRLMDMYNVVKAKERKKKKEKQFIKETVLRTTNTSSFQLSPSLSLSALFSIEIIQSERNVLCISQLKRNTTQSVKKKKTFYTGIEILYGFNLIMAKKVLHLN